MSSLVEFGIILAVTTMDTNDGISSASTTPKSHAQQHLHNHNANLGRIPPNADLRLPPKL
jgi:hypothetical protein